MIEVRKVSIPALSGDALRRCYIYLPDYYEEQPDRRFPVMYMFDGHNVFYDNDATYGKSWGMASYMGWTRKPLIIVAVECNHSGNCRLEEYSPFDFQNATLGKIHGRGKIYMDWLVGTLKPAIDSEFRTLTERENTVLCGSSMGGLMSLYGAVCYNDVFQRAACLSPSLWLAQDKAAELIARANIKRDTCIYMDYGSKEMYNHAANVEALTSAVHTLLIKHVNLTFRIVPGGTHSEASWEQQVPIFMDCLGL